MTSRSEEIPKGKENMEFRCIALALRPSTAGPGTHELNCIRRASPTGYAWACDTVIRKASYLGWYMQSVGPTISWVDSTNLIAVLGVTMPPKIRSGGRLLSRCHQNLDVHYAVVEYLSRILLGR